MFIERHKGEAHDMMIYADMNQDVSSKEINELISKIGIRNVIKLHHCDKWRMPTQQ